MSANSFMEEEVKDQPKGYKLEELLALINDDGKEDSSASGAKDWIENPTRFKLRESKHHLDIAYKAYVDYKDNTTDENRDALLFDLSAFFSAIRSITGNYMQGQYGDKPGFKNWYSQQNLGADPELRFLNNVRVGFVHLKPRIVATKRGASYQLAPRIVYADDHPLKETAPPLPDTLPPEPVVIQGPVTYDVVFMVDEEMKKLGSRTCLTENRDL